MPENSARLNIPLPLGADQVSRQAIRDMFQAVDDNAAKQVDHAAHLADTAAHGIGSLEGDIINNSINILKTKFSLDTHLNTTKHSLSQMVIDVLSNNTGISSGLSSGFFYNTEMGALEVGINEEIVQTTYSTSKVIGNSGGTNYAEAQRFKANANLGGLSNIAVAVHSGGKSGTSPAIEVHIYSDNAGNVGSDISTIGYAAIPQNEWVSQGYWGIYEITLDSPLVSDNYYWAVTKPIENMGAGNYALWRVNPADVYADGYVSVSQDGGSTWINSTSLDFLFKVGQMPAETKIIWTSDTAESAPTKVFMAAVQILRTGDLATFYISRDGGNTFTQCALEELVDISSQPSGAVIVAKAILTRNAKLASIGWGWK